MKTELSKEDLETILTINQLVDICLNIPTKEDIDRIDRQIKLLEEYDKSHTESDINNGTE